MHEPLRLVTVILILALLAPFGVVFWRAARFVPLSDPSRRDDLETHRKQIRDALAEVPPIEPHIGEDEVVVHAELQHAVAEMISVHDSAPLWLMFYPHRLAGLIGLLSLQSVLVCSLISLFVPATIVIKP